MALDIFEFASRKKLRFPYKGLISTEALWDLSLPELDSVYKNLNRELKKHEEESLLETKTQEDQVLVVMIDIVKHIADVKIAEKNAKEKEAANKAKKQQILAIIADKQNEALKNSSIEELTKMLDEING